MNQRMLSIINGLSGVARKVFDVVPIADEWTAQQMHRELLRLGHNVDIRTLTGCLASLCGSKLIIESSRGNFKKPPIKQEQEKVKTTKPVVELVKAESAPDAESPIDILGRLSFRVTEIIGSLKKLASEIDTAALIIEERFSESEEKSEKLKQLQQLLKSLS